MTTSMSKARAAKEVVKRLLAGVDGISGIGVGWDTNGDPVVLVNVSKQAAANVRTRLARQPLGVPIVIEEVGAISFEG